MRSEDLVTRGEEIRAQLQALQEKAVASEISHAQQKETIRQLTHEVERLSSELTASMGDQEKLIGELSTARGHRGVQLDAQIALGRELKARAYRLRDGKPVEEISLEEAARIAGEVGEPVPA